MQDQLSTTFAALADPTRRALLARLALGETSVTELARPFEMSMPAVSKHLKVLERAGLISRGREAQWRPCKLDAGPLRDASNWIEEYRRYWDKSFDQLEKYLREMKGARTKAKTNGQGTNGQGKKGSEKNGTRSGGEAHTRSHTKPHSK
jgi:DNA-binding transcriptional ArsR family regulator